MEPPTEKSYIYVEGVFTWVVTGKIGDETFTPWAGGFY
jgi:hypothetical protein